MEEKEFATTKKVTSELIGGFFLWGILFGSIYSFLYSLIVRKVFSNSLIGTSITAIILQGITVILVWKFSTITVFKKRTIYTHEVSTVMKNLTIFTIIICLITAIYNFSQINSRIDKIIESDISLSINDLYASYLYNAKEKAQYEAQRKEAISKAKGQVYGYLTVLEIGLLAVYFGVLPLEKKNILKYTVNG